MKRKLTQVSFVSVLIINKQKSHGAVEKKKEVVRVDSYGSKHLPRLIKEEQSTSLKCKSIVLVCICYFCVFENTVKFSLAFCSNNQLLDQGEMDPLEKTPNLQLDGYGGE